MSQLRLFVYNTLTREKEAFEPIHAPFVGMYLCGPTVYGHPHLGHARSALTFDVVFRTLKFLGYQVRYVRNITDVGHLEQDADSGEDKIGKLARLQQLEPMEVAQLYTNSYHAAMHRLNNLPPSIEPRATGHIPEQLELVQEILDKGYAYVSNGSVYFDVQRYAEHFKYGQLSGRKIEDLIEGASSRILEGQEEKRSKLDFALWKKAEPEHIMRWNSPWGSGFPGWHLECTAMSSKYLGKQFDIHGGGMDLQFPHHECEIAQAEVGLGHSPAKYWMHNNMITIDGQKMSKSLGNFITLEQFFNGDHPLLSQAYSPMAIRFFILQAHYRSTLDFSDEALQAAEKGYKRLMSIFPTLDAIQPSANTTGFNFSSWQENSLAVLLDDFNTPLLLANLFEGVTYVNKVKAGLESISSDDLKSLKDHFNTMCQNVLGLEEENDSQDRKALIDGLVALLVEQRADAKARKDFATSDALRDKLKALGVQLKDGKEGTCWEVVG